MTYSDDEFMRVFKMGCELRWTFHDHRCTWLDKGTLDPNCGACKARMDWDAYIDGLRRP